MFADEEAYIYIVCNIVYRFRPGGGISPYFAYHSVSVAGHIPLYALIQSWCEDDFEKQISCTLCEIIFFKKGNTCRNTCEDTFPFMDHNRGMYYLGNRQPVPAPLPASGGGWSDGTSCWKERKTKLKQSVYEKTTLGHNPLCCNFIAFSF